MSIASKSGTAEVSVVGLAPTHGSTSFACTCACACALDVLSGGSTSEEIGHTFEKEAKSTTTIFEGSPLLAYPHGPPQTPKQPVAPLLASIQQLLSQAAAEPGDPKAICVERNAHS